MSRLHLINFVESNKTIYCSIYFTSVIPILLLLHFYFSMFSRISVNHYVLRANYSPTKSLVPPTRFQNPNPNLNPNPESWTLTLPNPNTLTQHSGRYKRFSGRIRSPDYVLRYQPYFDWIQRFSNFIVFFILRIYLSILFQF